MTCGREPAATGPELPPRRDARHRCMRFGVTGRSRTGTAGAHPAALPLSYAHTQAHATTHRRGCPRLGPASTTFARPRAPLSPARAPGPPTLQIDFDGERGVDAVLPHRGATRSMRAGDPFARIARHAVCIARLSITRSSACLAAAPRSAGLGPGITVRRHFPIDERRPGPAAGRWRRTAHGGGPPHDPASDRLDALDGRDVAVPLVHAPLSAASVRPSSL